jgi:hypothetical protein
VTPVPLSGSGRKRGHRCAHFLEKFSLSHPSPRNANRIAKLVIWIKVPRDEFFQAVRFLADVFDLVDSNVCCSSETKAGAGVEF